MESSIDELAKIIWNYHCLNQKLEKADCILVLCSHDLRVAKYSAKLFLENWAPLLVFSGGVAHQDDLLKTGWDKPEAEIFAAVATEMGVPADKILIENKSTNTGENVQFTKELLKKRNLDPKRVILVQKPYMERRAYATFKKIWPEKYFIITSPQISFEDYPDEQLSKDFIINIIVGDLQRIKEYPAQGFQIPQEIPQEVWQAYEKLMKLGYTKHLIS